MKDNLAFNLIGRQLEWTDLEFKSELSFLQIMVGYKYDAYQGFDPASRFHVALLNCLNQFANLADRRAFYRFIKEHLIFVSQREMHHLVSLLMPLIDRAMRRRVAAELKLPLFLTWSNPHAKRRLDLMRRRSESFYWVCCSIRNKL